MCLTPWNKKGKTAKDANVMVPCGKCPQCVARRTSAWSFRLMQEEKRSSSAHFLTLTYATENIPYTRTGKQTLCKRDMQLFFKRLRKSHQKHSAESIRYFVAGEYGERTNRPHYHIIIFNARIDLLQPAWDKGSIFYGSVTGASIGYTLKYISKPAMARKDIHDDRGAEFQLQSKGLGSNYLTPQMIKWHKSNLTQKMYCTLQDNKKITMPRYYKDKIYTKDERYIISKHHQEKLYIEKLKFNSQENYDHEFQQLNQRVLAAFRKQDYSTKTLQKL